jgi:hypothetical protein
MKPIRRKGHEITLYDPEGKPQETKHESNVIDARSTAMGLIEPHQAELGWLVQVVYLPTDTLVIAFKVIPYVDCAVYEGFDWSKSAPARAVGG